MLSLHPSPVLPAAPPAGVFVQTITLQSGDQIIGRAVWSSPDPVQGAVQLIEFWIDSAHRRAGHGRQLLRGVLTQARAFHQNAKFPLRRLWAGVGHRSQVVGRAFLSSEGFHHISTTGGLFNQEEMLIYIKSLD